MLDLATVDRVLEDLAEAVVPGKAVEEGRALSARPPAFKSVDDISDHIVMIVAEFSEEIGILERQLNALGTLAGQEYAKAKKSGNPGALEAVRAHFEKTAKGLTARALVLAANIENLGMNVFPTLQKTMNEFLVKEAAAAGKWGRETAPAGQRAGARPPGHETQRVDAPGSGTIGHRTTQATPSTRMGQGASNNRVTQVSPGYRSSGAR